MHSLQGKVIVLTGASSGIGEQAALQLAAKGARLCLLARREDELQRVQAQILQAGGQADYYAVDLSDSQARERVCAALLSDHATIDVLINNAAHSIRRPIVSALDRLHDYERTVQLNYLAAVDLTLRLLPRFQQQGHGHVVSISTLSTQLPVPLFSAYLASKAASESFTRSLAAELGDAGITTSTVYFPMVRTPMSSRTALYKHMRMMDTAQAATWIVNAVERKPVRVSSVVGIIGSVLMAAAPGPLLALFRPFFRRMDRQLSRKLQQDSNDSAMKDA